MDDIALDPTPGDHGARCEALARTIAALGAQVGTVDASGNLAAIDSAVVEALAGYAADLRTEGCNDPRLRRAIAHVARAFEELHDAWADVLRARGVRP